MELTTFFNALRDRGFHFMINDKGNKTQGIIAEECYSFYCSNPLLRLVAELSTAGEDEYHSSGTKVSRKRRRRGYTVDEVNAWVAAETERLQQLASHSNLGQDLLLSFRLPNDDGL